MSESCLTPLAPQACGVTQDSNQGIPCPKDFGAQQGLFVQNFVANSVFAFTGDNLYCFSIPGFTQQTVNGQTSSPAQYFVTVPTTQPTTFFFQDSVTGQPYGQVTTSQTAPSAPYSVTDSPPVIVPPTNTPSKWILPDMRSEKPLWLLIAAGALWLLASVLCIAVGARRNEMVYRVYAKEKGATEDDQVDALLEEPQLKAEYAPFLGGGAIALGTVGLLVLAGLVVGFMFLPGFPLSKYMSYGQCQALAAREPQNLWAWSLPPAPGFFKFACQAFGACLCRSTALESGCFKVALTQPQYQPNVWQAALKKPPVASSCLCCAGGQCATVVGDDLQACTQ